VIGKLYIRNIYVLGIYELLIHWNFSRECGQYEFLFIGKLLKNSLSLTNRLKKS